MALVDATLAHNREASAGASEHRLPLGIAAGIILGISLGMWVAIWHLAKLAYGLVGSGG